PIAADCLLGVSIAAVGGHGRAARLGFDRRRWRRDGRASEMHVHFGIEHAFHSGLRQGAQQIIKVFERFGSAGNVTGELLGLELEGRVHASISVSKDGWELYPVRVPDTRSLTGPEMAGIGRIPETGRRRFFFLARRGGL